MSFTTKRPAMSKMQPAKDPAKQVPMKTPAKKAPMKTPAKKVPMKTPAKRAPARAQAKKTSAETSNQKNIPNEEEIKSLNVNTNFKTGRCSSIQNKLEPQNRCLFAAKLGEKFCPLHLLETNPIIYNGDIVEIPTVRVIEPTPINPIIITTKITPPVVLTDDQSDDMSKKYARSQKAIKHSGKKPVKKSDIIYEHKSEIVKQNYDDTEAEMEVKLLIMVNDEEYVDKIPALIGPAYADITLSDDDVDPITLDPIWYTTTNGRVPAQINKYFLFSVLKIAGRESITATKN